MTGTHEVGARVLTRTHKVAGSLLGDARHPHSGELAEAQQPGQLQGIAAVGLDALAGGSGNLRRGSHKTGDLRCCAGTRQAEPGGPGLVGDRDGFALGEQPGHKLGGTRRGTATPHLAGSCVKYGGGDRSYVHVKTYERRLTHAAPPR